MVPSSRLCKGFRCYIFSGFPQSSTTAMHSAMCKLREMAACAPMIASRRLRKLQRGQLLCRISARVDLRMDLRDTPLFVDDVRDTASVLILRRLGGAVRQPDLVVGIAQKREVEFLLLREFS